MTVVCKATFDLVPGEARLAAEQEHLNRDETHRDDDPARSVFAPCDLVPFKPLCDVTLVGHAFAPGKEPARQVQARLVVGDVDKTIEVHGDRYWTAAGLLHEGPKFTRMALQWERAAGGPSTVNPVGVRLDGPPDSSGLVAVPNLQPPALLLTDPSDFIMPVGFGPIAAAWPMRRERLGRHAAGWSPASWTTQPMPEGIDPAFFNAAPRDQQVESLRASERIVLENLHPDHVRLVTALPGIQPRAFVERRSGPPQELNMICDTLWIDTDRSLVTLTWRTQVALEHPAQPGRVLVAMARPGERVSFADAARLAAAKDDDEEGTRTGYVAQRRVEPVASSSPLSAPLEVVRPSQVPPSTESVWMDPRTPSSTTARSTTEPASLGFAPTLAGAEVGLAAAAIASVSVLSRGEVVDLLWFDVAAPAAIRARDAWKPIVAEVEPREGEELARRLVQAVLVRGAAPGGEDSSAALGAAVAADGSFTPPVVVVAGELSLPFDELDVLRATATAVLALSAGDEKSRATIAAAAALLDAPWTIGASVIAEGLTGRLREAFAQQNRMLPPTYLDARVERALLQERRYQRRDVLGQRRLRALFTTSPAAAAVPAYLPESQADRLPMFLCFRVRLLAEVHFQQDQYEAIPSALRVLALGRVVAMPGKKA